MPTESVVLTGFMATGKSTVGRLLAEHLGFDFVDTDRLIEEQNGPIADIFRDEGEEAFRSLERLVVAQLADRTQLVISTGGRLMLDPLNAGAFVNHRVFCLTATADQILDRVQRESTGVERPLLAGTDPRGRIRELLAERAAGYAQFDSVATGDRSPCGFIALEPQGPQK